MKKILTVILLTSVATASFAIDAAEIVKRMEDNQVFVTSYSKGRLVIEDRFGERTSTFEAWAKGEDYSLIEFTSADEAGQKVLRTPDALYLYYPDAEEVIRLQGAALRESLLDSDFSYEDMTGDKGLLDTFNVTLTGEEVVDGHNCYVLELEAKGRNVPYPKEKLWIDAERFVGRRQEKYSLSGRLLKELRMIDFKEQDGLYFPVTFIMEDKLKRNSSTTFYMDDIQINVTLDDDVFSLQNLSF